jgi:hypothetical protein
VVHVNRTLRLLREEKIAIVDKHVVILRDMTRLRLLASREPNDAPGTEDAMPAEAAKPLL